MISVLMSLYHKENPLNLRECLDSLCIQSYPPDEVVVVFDGPLGKELELVISDFEHSLPMKIIRLENNIGLGRALNIGLDNCSHEIIARMDTDDICIYNRLEVQMNYLQENPNIDILGSSVLEFGENSLEIEKKLPLRNADIIEFSKKKNPFNHMTVIFKKQAIIDVGGYIDHYFMEDYNLWLRLISAKCILENLPDVLVKARVGEDMLRRRRGLKYIDSEFKLFLLKIKLGITGCFDGLFYLSIRVLARIVPLGVLRKIYYLDRKKAI